MNKQIIFATDFRYSNSSQKNSYRFIIDIGLAKERREDTREILCFWSFLTSPRAKIRFLLHNVLLHFTYFLFLAV